MGKKQQQQQRCIYVGKPDSIYERHIYLGNANHHLRGSGLGLTEPYAHQCTQGGRHKTVGLMKRAFFEEKPREQCYAAASGVSTYEGHKVGREHHK